MDTDRTIDVMVEIPRGSRNKYEYDHEHHVFRLDRRLFSATFYPADYGFVPDTLAEDGDPLDALVLIDEPTFPGCMVESRPVGVFWMTDEKGPDAKIISRGLRRPDVGEHPQPRRAPAAPHLRDRPLLRGLQGPRAAQAHRGARLRRGRGGLGGDRPLLSSGRAPGPERRPQAGPVAVGTCSSIRSRITDAARWIRVPTP